MNCAVIINGSEQSWEKQVRQIIAFPGLQGVCAAEVQELIVLHEGGRNQTLELISECRLTDGQHSGVSDDQGLELPKQVADSLARNLAGLIGTQRVTVLSGGPEIKESAMDRLHQLLQPYELCLFSGTFFGQEAAVRLAARRGGVSLTGVSTFDPAKRTAERRIYAGHETGCFQLPEKPVMLALDPELPASQQFPESKQADVVVSYEDLSPDEDLELLSCERPSDDAGLQDAKQVVVLGMGAGGKQQAECLTEEASACGFAVGATRPAAMNAWLPMDRLIGVSGAILSPDVCILLGVSGAPAFYSGIKNSRTIVAVNKDPDAPVMQKADLAVVGDCTAVLEELTKHLTGRWNETTTDDPGSGHPSGISAR